VALWDFLFLPNLIFLVWQKGLSFNMKTDIRWQQRFSNFKLAFIQLKQAVDLAAELNAVFSRFSKVKKVVIYGSRAKGTFRIGSDIDLVLVGELLTSSHLLKIENELDDLLLPFKIALSLLYQIENSDLVDHIQRCGKRFLHQ
jgi:predicted nucleotidyltransferase